MLHLFFQFCFKNISKSWGLQKFPRLQIQSQFLLIIVKLSRLFLWWLFRMFDFLLLFMRLEDQEHVLVLSLLLLLNQPLVIHRCVIWPWNVCWMIRPPPLMTLMQKFVMHPSAHAMSTPLNNQRPRVPLQRVERRQQLARVLIMGGGVHLFTLIGNSSVCESNPLYWTEISKPRIGKP